MPTARATLRDIEHLVFYAAALARAKNMLPETAEGDAPIAEVVAELMPPELAEQLHHVVARYEQSIGEQVQVARIAVIANELVPCIHKLEAQAAREGQPFGPGVPAVRDAVAAELRRLASSWEMEFGDEKQVAGDCLGPADRSEGRKGVVAAALARGAGGGGAMSAGTLVRVMRALDGQEQTQGKLRDAKSARAFAVQEVNRRDVMLWCVSIMLPELEPAEVSRIVDVIRRELHSPPPDDPQAE